MDIRILGSDDADAFQPLRLQGLRECPTAFTSSYEEEQDIARDVIAQRLSKMPDRVVFGAFEGSALVGVVGLKRESHRKLAHKATIWGMYIEPASRHRGIGRRLMERVLAQAATLPGLRQVVLGVNAANSGALALYRSVGFESFGIERGFMLIDGVMHDEIHMVCVLPNTE